MTAASPGLLFNDSAVRKDHGSIELCNNEATESKEFSRIGLKMCFWATWWWDCRVGGVNSKPNNTSMLLPLPGIRLHLALHYGIDNVHHNLHYDVQCDCDLEILQVNVIKSLKLDKENVAVWRMQLYFFILLI